MSGKHSIQGAHSHNQQLSSIINKNFDLMVAATSKGERLNLQRLAVMQA